MMPVIRLLALSWLLACGGGGDNDLLDSPGGAAMQVQWWCDARRDARAVVHALMARHCAPSADRAGSCRRRRLAWHWSRSGAGLDDVRNNDALDKLAFCTGCPRTDPAVVYGPREVVGVPGGPEVHVHRNVYDERLPEVALGRMVGDHAGRDSTSVAPRVEARGPAPGCYFKISVSNDSTCGDWFGVVTAGSRPGGVTATNRPIAPPPPPGERPLVSGFPPVVGVLIADLTD
jgi:hypothetical protein